MINKAEQPHWSDVKAMSDRPKPPDGYVSWIDWALVNFADGIDRVENGGAITHARAELAEIAAVLREVRTFVDPVSRPGLTASITRCIAMLTTQQEATDGK